MYQCLLAERALHFLYHGSGLRRSLLCFRMLYTYLFNGRAELRWTRHSLGNRRRRGLRNKSRRRRHMSGNDLLAGSRSGHFLRRLYRTLQRRGRLYGICLLSRHSLACLSRCLALPVGGYRLNQPFFFIIGRLSGTA